ncbi:MAG: hypothetical protein AB1631_20830, partial [Acidobacteriota bacterium]
MIEYWAVLGLAVVDHHFREALFRAREDRSLLDRLMKEHCFRLSRYELGELQRVISTPGVVERLAEI